MAQEQPAAGVEDADQADPGSDPAADPGSDPAADPGPDPAADPGADPGAGPESVTEPERKPEPPAEQVATPEPGAAERPGAPRRRWRWLAVPLGVYVATRVVQFALVAWLLPAGDTVRSQLLSWDAGWFVDVAQHGYPHSYTRDVAGNLVGNGLAFFPGYPFLIAVVHDLTRLDYGTAALAASWLAGAVAAALVYALGARLYDTRVATVLTVLFCAQPMSVVLSMGYSEGLFVVLVCGALLAAYHRVWALVGLLGFAAALTRPTGAALALGLAVAALAEVRAHRPDARKAVLAAVLSLLGVPLYLAWVGARVGSWHAWFDIQTAGWGSTFDFGAGAARFVAGALHSGDGWIEVSVALLLITTVLLAVLAVTQRVWPPLLVYGLIALVLVLGQAGYYHSKPRLLVPVLLILLPVARTVAAARTRTAALVLTGYALFGLWYGAYLITVWHYAI